MTAEKQTGVQAKTAELEKQTATATTAGPAATQPARPPGDFSRTPVLAGRLGLELRTIEECYRFAAYAVRAGIGTKGMTPEEGVIRIQFGAELGMGPARSIGSIMVVNGKPSIYGDDMLALCMENQRFDHDVFGEWIEGSVEKGDAVAHCRVGRLGRSKPVERTFSAADAKRAKLWGKDGPWTLYPQRMLQMRARAFALRDVFPDILRGMYATEEAGDISVERVLSQIDLDSGPTAADRDSVAAAIRAAKRQPRLQQPQHDGVRQDAAADVDRIQTACKSIFPDVSTIHRRVTLAKYVCGGPIAEAGEADLARTALILEAMASRVEADPSLRHDHKGLSCLIESIKAEVDSAGIALTDKEAAHV